ncbi:MAG TPA: hypothetical protein DDW52_27195, partial [Planctomycetaceae bacterium]|nr:hypothetical protein [Planctomycetaceae bacterium]
MLVAWYKLHVSRFIARRWYIVIAGWIAVAVTLKLVAPQWKDIAADGDLQFLPADATNSIGTRELAAAFPGSGSRSQMVIGVVDGERPIAAGNRAVALELARRLHWYAANSAWQRIQKFPVASPAKPPLSKTKDESATQESVEVAPAQLRKTVLETIVRENLDEAIKIEDELSRYLGTDHPEFEFKRLPDAYRLRGELLKRLGQEEQQASLDLETPKLLAEQAEQGLVGLLELEIPAWTLKVRDVWTWRNAIVGHKLATNAKDAQLIAVQLTTDFSATANIDVIEGLERTIADLRAEYKGIAGQELQLEIAGAAAIGADMLRAAASGVKLTEIATIVLVVVILAFVYRAPLLVAIPIFSIALSLIVATSTIALLARDPMVPDSWGLGVFTTTRIFIVVILFGAGTDFCLFLLARNRELLVHRRNCRAAMQRAVSLSWLSVHDALLASALTTMIGLGMMYFSEFEKFQFSGPIIAISLGITLIVCLTFTPALCAALGRLAFWPSLKPRDRRKAIEGDLVSTDQLTPRKHREIPGGLWRKIATAVVERPARSLVLGSLLLAPGAIWGIYNYSAVTYDLTNELPTDAPSRKGQALVGRFFPTRQASPITVLATLPAPLDEQAMQAACTQLANALYIDGVESVRHLADPLGDYPPGKRQGLFDSDAWRLRLLKNHRITSEKYISRVDQFSARVARFDVIISPDAFSTEAATVLDDLRQAIASETRDATSTWFLAQVSFSGTAVGINDLRQVTQADQRRIQVLVTLGVWLVLVAILGRPLLASYLIITVLISYLTTLGITHAVFAGLYGDNYQGLDWKVPIFLFVILVAVGQDYNVYLVTRIFEEQRH